MLDAKWCSLQGDVRGSCANKGLRSITSDAHYTDVSNAEAAATPPPQLRTQHASEFRVPVFFFFFKFVREVGLAINQRGFSQIWLQVREQSEKVLRIVLHFGDRVERIVNIWRLQKKYS